MALQSTDVALSRGRPVGVDVSSRPQVIAQTYFALLDVHQIAAPFEHAKLDESNDAGSRARMTLRKPLHCPIRNGAPDDIRPTRWRSRWLLAKGVRLFDRPPHHICAVPTHRFLSVCRDGRPHPTGQSCRVLQSLFKT